TGRAGSTTPSAVSHPKPSGRSARAAKRSRSARCAARYASPPGRAPLVIIPPPCHLRVTGSGRMTPQTLSLTDPARRAYDGERDRPVRVELWRADRADAPLVVLSHGTGGAARGLAWWSSA